MPHAELIVVGENPDIGDVGHPILCPGVGANTFQRSCQHKAILSTFRPLGTINPYIMLDLIDKVGENKDYNNELSLPGEAGPRGVLFGG